MRVETITARLRREYEACLRRRKSCEDNGLHYSRANREELERAETVLNAHEIARAKRRRFGPKRVLARWARMRGFRAHIIGSVGQLHIDRGDDEFPVPILVALGYGGEAHGFGYFVTFAREPLVGKPKHILGVTLDSRTEAVRFAGALLAVLS